MQGNDSEVMCKITRTLQSIILTDFHTGWMEKSRMKWKKEEDKPRQGMYLAATWKDTHTHTHVSKLSFYEYLFTMNIVSLFR